MQTQGIAPQVNAQLAVLFHREARDARIGDDIGESARLGRIASELDARSRAQGFRGDPFSATQQVPAPPPPAPKPAPVQLPPPVPWKPVKPVPQPPKPGCGKC